jgi:hypothetical protein
MVSSIIARVIALWQGVGTSSHVLQPEQRFLMELNLNGIVLNRSGLAIERTTIYC